MNLSDIERSIKKAGLLQRFLIFILLFGAFNSGFAQQKRDVTRRRSPTYRRGELKSPTKKPQANDIEGQEPGLQTGEPHHDIWLTFNLEWTNCKIHRIGDYSSIQIILNGEMSSSDPETWHLSSALADPDGSPDLQFIEDVLGRSGAPYGQDIPLTWEISLDSGAFVPMTILPNNNIVYTFPAGTHTFQVRITGPPVLHQADGYYNLPLLQTVIPVL